MIIDNDFSDDPDDLEITDVTVTVGGRSAPRMSGDGSVAVLLTSRSPVLVEWKE